MGILKYHTKHIRKLFLFTRLIEYSGDSMTSIVYLGIPGSFSYAAAQNANTPDDTYIGAASFRDIFKTLTQGGAERGIIPIENSLAGSIYENYDLLDSSGLHVLGEQYLRVQHSLLVSQTVTQAETDVLKNITKIYSHPKALEQCQELFAQHPYIEKQAYGDTATAARFVAEQDDPTIAAIASPVAAELYNLRILKDHIEDYPDNFTRFLIVASQAVPRREDNKCSLIVRLPHVPGSLHAFLQILAEHSCNMTKLESRPWRNKPFEYVFYIDFCFDPQAQSVDMIIDDLKKQSMELKVLGVYADQAASML